MRGKIIVLVMLISAAILFVVNVWYVNDHTPLDDRFNMRRDALAADAPGAMILRERAGDYYRVDLHIDTMDATSERHGSATYTVEGKIVTLEAQQLPTNAAKPDINALFGDFMERSGATDIVAVTVTSHPDARIPFAYGVYPGPNYTYHEFAWINGSWLFRAWTREAGSETLLRFVNSYPY